MGDICITARTDINSYGINMGMNNGVNTMLTLTAVTVSPALVLPMPVVNTDLGTTLEAYLRNCDFPVPAVQCEVGQLMSIECDFHVVNFDM